MMIRERAPDALWVDRAADLRPKTLRSRMRHAALDLLALLDRWSERRLEASPRVQILVFHHVFPDEVRAFRGLLTMLRRHFRFISYGEAVERIGTGRVDDAYLAFSFDDGLKCCVQAAEILEEFGARGCFFICPPVIGQTDHEEVRRFCRDRLRSPPVPFLTWDDVEQLRRNGHEIGGHTMNHVDLAQISPAQAQQEIGESFEVLRDRLGDVAHFAWPYGRFFHASREVVRAVFRSGYRSCASAERGCHGPSAAIPPTDVCLRRDSLEANWPLSHVAYFLKRSAARPLPPAETWPSAWKG